MSCPHWIPFLALFVSVTACSGLDGGIEPTTRLPAPRPADTTGGDTLEPDAADPDTATPDTTDPDASARPTLSFVSPIAGASVDGDWIAVSLALQGHTLGAGDAIVLASRSAAGQPMHEVVTTSLAGVLLAGAGEVVLSAELTSAGAPLDPPVVAEVAVTSTRTTPTLTLTRPADGEGFAEAAPVSWALSVTDFTLLPSGADATGPRQGRVRLVVDGGAPDVVHTTSGTLPSLAAGAHTLEASLVDAAGAPWDPPVTASVAFAVGVPPTVTIVSPADGAIVTGARLPITIATERFVLDGQTLPGHGTWRVSLDGVQVATGLTGTTAELGGLASGEHTLRVELRAGGDQPLVPEVSAEASFETRLLPPGVDLVLPTSDEVAEGAVRVAVRPHHFWFSTRPIPAPLVPTSGGWQLLVDGEIAADRLTTSQTEVVLTPGTRRLTARLIDNAGAPLDPLIEASRTLEVAPLETSVTILSPRPGEVVPKRFPVAVAFEDFVLSGEVLAPSDPPVPGRGHFHAFLRKQGTASFVYQGFFLTESFELQADSPGVWEVAVALHHENHSPVTPAVEATVTVTVDDRPMIRAHSPDDGAVLGRDPFAVAVAVDNFTLIPIGEVSNTKGHFHVFIDAVYQGFYIDPFAVIDPLATLPSALAPGPHELSVFLHRSDHTPVAGALGDTLEVVYDPTPKVRVLAPTPGARVTTAPFTVAFELDSLALVDKQGQAAVPGEGHVHVFVDGEYIGVETTPTFELAIAAPGRHTITLTLHDNDHTAIAGTAPASVEVVVDATARAAIVTPEDMGFVYGGDVEVAFAAENWHGGTVELWLDDALVYEGPPETVTLDRPSDGLHTLTAVPLGPGGAPTGEVVTHRFELVGIVTPAVSFVTPAPNATLAPGAAVTIGTSGFTIGGSVGRAPAVPGDGLWTLSDGARTWGPFSTPTVPLPALPFGAATLTAELWHRDGSRVSPRAVAQVPVQIGATPRVSITEPAVDVTIYGDAIELRAEVVGAALGAGQGWLSVKVDGRQEALLGRAHGTLGPFAAGLHLLEIELLGADLAPLSPRVTASSRFRVDGSGVPTVAIMSPVEGASVTAGAIDVAFAVTGLELDPLGLGGRPQVGRGAALVVVDGRVRAVATHGPVRLTGLTPGAHTIEVVLAGLDLVPILPAVRDSVTVR